MAGSGYSVVPVQGAFTPLRIIQVILGVAVLGLSCYPVSLYTSTGLSSVIFEPGALGIFTGIATGIFVAYWFIATSASNQKLYNYWALMAVEMFVWVFWLTTFALYADFVAGTLALYNSYTDYSSLDYSYSGSGSGSGSGQQYCYAGICVTVKRGLTKRSTSSDPFSATIYSALAFSVLNFILFSVTMVLFIINLVRHRSAKHSSHVEAQNGMHAHNGQSPMEMKG